MRYRLPVPGDRHGLAALDGTQKLGKAGLGLSALDFNHFGRRLVMQQVIS